MMFPFHAGCKAVPLAFKAKVLGDPDLRTVYMDGASQGGAARRHGQRRPEHIRLCRSFSRGDHGARNGGQDNNCLEDITKESCS
jgi:hypothetical protein